MCSLFLTTEGFIGDAFNEEGEVYKTVTITFEEFADLPQGDG